MISLQVKVQVHAFDDGGTLMSDIISLMYFLYFKAPLIEICI